METISLAIVDDNESFVDALKEKVTEDPEYQLAGVAYNGEDGLRLIRVKKPDIVILDIIMPRMDGLTVMDRIQYEEGSRHTTDFIVVSAVGREEIAQEAFELGARYYIRKPVAPETVMGKVRRLSKGDFTVKTTYPLLRGSSQVVMMAAERPRHYFTGNPQIDVTSILQEIGVPAHVRGYQYLRDAILFSMESPSLLTSASKKLYPKVAEEYSTTTGRVERAIRHAIESAWNKGGMEEMNRLFRSEFNMKKGRPTNSEFIAQISDKLTMEYKIALSNK